MKVSRWLLAGFSPPHGGQSYAHQSCAKVLGLAWGRAPGFFLGPGAVLLTQQKCAKGQARGCVPSTMAPSGSVACERVSASSLYVRPLKVFMQV